MIINVDTKGGEYEIVLERGCLSRAAELLNIGRNCLIVTDTGVPAKYVKCVAGQCKRPVIATVPQGEGGKSMQELEHLLTIMLENGFTRSDCVIAVGGGVPGDLAGFAAATYMRGIDFYNIPTTVLSQADSSVGGKTAVNLGGAKNIAGAFWQPRGVLIDTAAIDTLPDEQKASGAAEIIKAGLIADASLFERIEKICTEGRSIFDDNNSTALEEILEAALRVKKAVVEEDEREGGRRRILNFGHTIGHGIESVTGMLHGEAVALGMIPMCSPELRSRLKAVLRATGLQTQLDPKADKGAIYQAMLKDKKMKDGKIASVYVDEPGQAYIRMTAPEELRERIESIEQ